MMEEAEDDDTYVTQLREVFNSCDSNNSGYLNREELISLCNKLQLADRTNLFIQHLLGENCTSQVNFEDFKEGFVHLLTHSVVLGNCTTDDRKDGILHQFSDQELSPKFTFGKKKYGRRSRPASLANNNIPMNCSSTDALCSFDSSLNTLPDERSLYARDVNDTTSNKRRVSIESTQQPPHKSGRLSNFFNTSSSTTHQSLELVCSSHSSGSGDTDNLGFQESNPEEYLQRIWKKLGVGEDGYLNIDELAHVCEHIGMEMSEEVITQLFEKLDCDQDGKVSFEEFLQGLFQHGGPNTSSDTSDSSLCASPLHHKGLVYKDGSRDDHKMAATCVSGLFSCIDSDHTGYADASTLVELWESLELTGGMRLLKELGFNTSQKINLQHLTSILEEELESLQNTHVYRFALLSAQNGLRHLRLSYDQLQEERDKLKEGIAEANTRAALLAQEVDEHHAKLERSLQNKLLVTEKKFQDQMRTLQEELQREREALGIQSVSLKQQFQKDVDTIREEETKLKSHMDALKKENSRLEQEVQDVTERYLEVERLSEAQQRELNSAAELKQKVAELESCHDHLQEQHHQALLLDLENHRKLNKELQDRIDELVLELENVRQNVTSSSTNSLIKQHHRTGSWLSDYKKASSPGCLKRRGSDSSSADDNSDYDSPMVGKIRRRLLLQGDDQNKSTFEMEYIQDNQTGKLGLKVKHEQAILTAEQSYKSKAIDLGTQLEKNILTQACLESEYIPKKQNRDELNQTLLCLQDDLKMQKEFRYSLEIEVLELKQQVTQLTLQNATILNERDLLISKLKEFNMEIGNNKNWLLEEERKNSSHEELKQRAFETEYKHELKRHLNKSDEEEHTKYLPKLPNTDINNHMEKSELIASDVVNTLRKELCQILKLFSSLGCLEMQKQLEDIMQQTINSVEAQLKVFYTEEREKLKQHWEEQLGKKHVMKEKKQDLQNKKELFKKSTYPLLEVMHPTNSDILMKEMYLENARLMRKLQLAEGQQRKIQKNNICLQYKCKVFSRLLTDISRSAVA